MPVISPSKEAQDALVELLNATDFSVDFEATATDTARTDLADGEWLSVDVIDDEEEQLVETLDSDDPTRHRILIQLTARRKPDSLDTTEDLKLLAREIHETVDQWDSADGRVQVWFVGREAVQPADKEALRALGLFRRNILCEVEVLA